MRLTSDEIFYLNELNSVSGANARDCVVQGSVIAFLVKKDDLGKAIGKNASNVKELRKKLRLNVEILEYCNGVEDFIKRALYNIKIKEVKVVLRGEKRYAILSVDSENKRKLQNSGSRLKRIRELAKRDYKVDRIKIR